MRNATYLDGTAATVSAIFDILGVAGAAELDTLDSATGRAVITASWEPRH